METEDSGILDEEIEVFKRCFVNTPEYIEKYKLYGPANPRINSCRLDEDFDVCENSNDGVCYMLTCNCIREDPEFPNKEWFNGKCNYVDSEGHKCRAVLYDKSYAWRTPLDNGGFNGCFCKDHFRRCVPRPDDPEEFSLYHTLCDVMIMVREKYPVQKYPSLDPESSILFKDDFEDL